MDDKLGSARKDLDKEFLQVREGIEKIRQKLDAVGAAGPEDDIHKLLEELEDTVKNVRTGGLLGSGAKGHRSARQKYFELKGTPT